MLQKSESKRLTMTKNWDSNLQRKVGFLPISNGSIKKWKVIQPLSDKMQSSLILKKNEEGDNRFISQLSAPP